MSSALTTFGKLSDDEWQTVIEATLQNRVQSGVVLPGFTDPAIQSQTVGSSGLSALREAGAFYRYVKQTCAASGRPVGPSSVILDFGVSWGRFVRFFLKDTDAKNIHGVDVSSHYLSAAASSGCPARLSLIQPRGRLPYDDQMFDLVYAYSVFTHLPEDVQDLWLNEIQRVLKPGGLLIATVEPPRFLDTFKNVDPNDQSQHPWHRQMAIKTKAPSVRTALERNGFAHMPQIETYGDTVMTEAYARSHWGALFEIVDWVDDPARFWQAVVAAKKRQ